MAFQKKKVRIGWSKCEKSHSLWLPTQSLPVVIVHSPVITMPNNDSNQEDNDLNDGCKCRLAALSIASILCQLYAEWHSLYNNKKGIKMSSCLFLLWLQERNAGWLWRLLLLQRLVTSTLSRAGTGWVKAIFAGPDPQLKIFKPSNQ